MFNRKSACSSGLVFKAMVWQYIYLLFIAISAATSVVLGVISLRFLGRTRAVIFFSPMMLIVALWQISSFFANLSREEQVTEFWMNLFFMSVILSAPLFLAFALQYTGHEKWVSGYRLPALFVIPIISIILTWTNPIHHWVFISVRDAIDGILLYAEHFEYGWYFWVHTVYSYALVLIAMMLIAQMAVRSYHIFRQQAITLMMGLVPGIATTVVDAFGLFPGFKHDIAPVGFALAGVFFFFSIYRRQFLNIVPIAREMLIEQMSDGMLVLNEIGQIVDINSAAESFLGVHLKEIMGLPMRDALLEWRTSIDAYLSRGIRQAEVPLKREGDHRIYDLQISSILDRRARTIGHLVVLRDITQNKHIEGELRSSHEKLLAQLDEINKLHALLQEQVIRDPLTGLYNRRYLNETLQRENERAARKPFLSSILMIDIDYFKQINDSYGHAVGDEILYSMSKEFTAHVRSSDMICRYGGEEFLIIMPDSSEDDALQRAEEIRTSIESTLFTVDDGQIHLTISIGVASFLADGRDLWEIIDAADMALYEAKSNGRNRVESAGQIEGQKVRLYS